MGKYFIPENLLHSTREIARDGMLLLRNGKYAESERSFSKLTEAFHEWEKKTGKRVHKGYPFHNFGLSLLFQGKSAEALESLIFAYIEDSIGSDRKGGVDNLPVASRRLQIVLVPAYPIEF